MSKAIVEDFQNVLRSRDGNGIAHPIIENMQTASRKRKESICKRSIAAGGKTGVLQRFCLHL
jgi:hypothetical protein